MVAHLLPIRLQMALARAPQSFMPFPLPLLLLPQLFLLKIFGGFGRVIGVFFELGPDSLGERTEGGRGKDSGRATEEVVEEGHCVDRVWAGGVI